jgi:XTP/dITP diphosphohydrolase
VKELEKPKVVVASRNRGKISEYRRMLDQAGFSVVSIDQAGVGDDVELPEEGDTFEANAFSKASALWKITGGWTLGDDSGLEVDALGGAPGVFSARYSGSRQRGSERDRANYEKLLRELQDVPDEKRTARFVCAIAMLGPNGPGRRNGRGKDGPCHCITTRGVCTGLIIRVPRGDDGFGYDPVFVVDGYDQTMAELTMDHKNRISHRGRALRGLVEKLKNPDAGWRRGLHGS